MVQFPNQDILIDAAWLREHLYQVKLLDVRASDPRLPIGYRMGHIPGAIALDPTRDFYVLEYSAPQLASVGEIANALGRQGVSSDSPIVIYDEWTGQLAALTYWIMRYVGHRDLRVLHGGWAEWKRSGGVVTREVPAFKQVDYAPQAQSHTRATAEWIQENANRPEVFLLDARTPDEFAMGHIPGARNLSYDAALDVRTQTFLDPEDIRRQLEEAGATPDKEIVTYCAAGARSAHMFLTLQLLGYKRVRNYEGSMTDWYHLRGLAIE